MGNIIGINLMQDQIYMAAPADERTFCVGVQGGDEELFATAKRASERFYGQPADEAVAVIPARLTVTQRGSLTQKASRRGIKVLRFVSLTNAALLGDYTRNGAEVRRIDPQLVLTVVLRGTYLELALAEVGSGVAELLAIALEEQANADSIPKAFRKLLADAGKNPEEVRRLVFAEDAIRNEIVFTEALDSALSCADVRNYTAQDLAMGAAAYGAKIKGSEEGLLLLDILPRSIGFKLVDGSFFPVLEHNVTYPVTQETPVFHPEENPKGLEITLYEGSAKLGTYHATSRQASEQSDGRYLLCMSMDVNGVLRVLVKDSAGNNLKLSAGAEGTYPLPVLIPPKREKQETTPERKEPQKREPVPAAHSAQERETVLKFLSVYDDLLLALDHPTKDPAYEKGIRLTLKKMEAIFQEHGVCFYASPGDAFDPHIHEAVMHMESAQYGTNVIAKVLKKGVKINGKITRYAMVQVAN